MSKILYNITIKVSHEVHDDWMQWMKADHIPKVMKAGDFLSYRVQRIIGDESDDGISYAIGYVAQSMASLHAYQVKHASQLQKEHQERYQGHFAAFRTLMEIVGEG